jgi:peptidoglycan hydrolase-like protein with peptidoglycan-binding domain
MKRVLLCLLVCSALPFLSRADDQLQSVQQTLKDQGFYYGTVDGQPGPETDAAIRRYQIREGLLVTGKLDAQTLSALNQPGGSTDSGNTANAQPAPPETPPPQTPPPDVVQSDHDILRNTPPPDAQAQDTQAAPQPPQPEPAQPEPAPPQPAAPPDDEAQAPAPPPPPGDAPAGPQPFEPRAPAQPQPYIGQVVPQDYSRFFRKTPYEEAPPVVQRNTIRKAEARLWRQGFYRGDMDGLLNDALSRALMAYQRDTDLRETGRLDMSTLADLNLLPFRGMTVPDREPYTDYPEQPPGAYAEPPPQAVYRGIWVR